MEKTFISARCDADLAEEFALLARARGESTSGFLRMAMRSVMAEHQEDDDPPDRAGRVEDSPDGASRVPA